MIDASLAVERTALAWSRTALGIVGVAALLLRFARVESVPLAGEVAAASAVLIALLARLQGRRSFGEASSSPASLRALALAVTALALACAAIVAVGLT